MRKGAQRLHRVFWNFWFACWFGVFGIGCASARSNAAASPKALEPATPETPSEVGPPVSLGLQQEAERVWRAVRARYPLHQQAVFEQLLGSGHRIVVVTEPPPHASLEGISLALGKARVVRKESVLGYDGWVRDAVAVLAPEPGALEPHAARLLDLHEYLFATSYGAEVLPIPEGPAASLTDSDWQVSPPELYDWVHDPAAEWLDVRTGAVMLGAELPSASGVFLHGTLGIVVWVGEVGADLCEQRSQIREFFLSSDVLLGAVQVDSHTLLVGRERTNPVLELPPLRTETLLQLAAARSAREQRVIESVSSGQRTAIAELELGQSFQRNNLFAGKLKNGQDWAPILLDDALKDTEFGGLLNITDQLLKSWSLNGRVEYANFSYRAPAVWAAPQAINDELRVASLTFNWNTSGALAITELPDAMVYTQQRTGALPITYLPDGYMVTGIESLERRNQDFFAKQADSNLIRVTNYAALLQLTELFRFRAECYAVQQARADKAERFLKDLAKTIVDGQESPLVHPANKQHDEALSVLEDQYHQVPTSSRATYLQALAGVKSPFAHEAARFDQQLRAVRKLGLGLNPDLDGLLDRDAILRQYQELSARPRTGWVGTPTVVVSKSSSAPMPGYVVYTMGGHNLRFSPVAIAADSRVQRGDPQVDAAGWERSIPFRGGQLVQTRARLRVHPDDLRWGYGQVLEEMRAVQNGRKSLEQARTDLGARLTNFSPDTSARSAPAKPAPPRQLLGWLRQRVSSPQAQSDVDAFVIRHFQGSEPGYLITHPNGSQVFAPGATAALRYVSAEGRRTRRTVARVSLDLRGFSAKAKADEFVREVERLLRSNQNASEQVVVLSVAADRVQLTSAGRALGPPVATAEQLLNQLSEAAAKGNLVVPLDALPEALRSAVVRGMEARGSRAAGARVQLVNASEADAAQAWSRPFDTVELSETLGFAAGKPRYQATIEAGTGADRIRLSVIARNLITRVRALVLGFVGGRGAKQMKELATQLDGLAPPDDRPFQTDLEFPAAEPAVAAAWAPLGGASR